MPSPLNHTITTTIKKRVYEAGCSSHAGYLKACWRVNFELTIDSSQDNCMAKMLMLLHGLINGGWYTDAIATHPLAIANQYLQASVFLDVLEDRMVL